MSYDGNGKPGKGVWSTSHEPEWDVARRRPGNKTDRLQREPARGWHRNAIAMNLCKIDWTRSGTNVLLGRQSRQGESRTPPIA
jgi:hypothetical protein